MSYEFGRHYEVWPCPFCRQETINVTRFPKCVIVKRSKTASLPGSKGFHVNRDVCVITSGCAKCGRPFEGIEKKLKEEGLI